MQVRGETEIPDPRHRPARFPHVKIRERPRRESNSVRLVGRRVVPPEQIPFGGKWRYQLQIEHPALHCGLSELLCPGGTLHEFASPPANARRLDCSPPNKASRVQSLAGSLRIFASGNRAGDDVSGWRAFSAISRFPRSCIPAPLHSHLISPSSALKPLVEGGARRHAGQDGISSFHNDYFGKHLVILFLVDVFSMNGACIVSKPMRRQKDSHKDMHGRISHNGNHG
ncbi:hypothetical protein PR048_003544 [Dryococelus australis]|uniref:Uncharacterized protein n=1 Tax=Dryococelus australis TaxID=614101 RepID=A0ABQ9IND3_9NEOP|nr:hypothetical protein PR048_003544 [Dryococelus australis]